MQHTVDSLSQESINLIDIIGLNDQRILRSDFSIGRGTSEGYSFSVSLLN
jgi:hypothetical protein